MPELLNEITGRARKCGPCALSAVLGISSHEAARIIREDVRQSSRPVNGVSIEEMLAALATYEDVWYHHEEWGCSLRRFFDQMADDLPVIVATATHYIAAVKTDKGVQVADTGAWFNRKPKLWDGSQARRRVQFVITVGEGDWLPWIEGLDSDDMATLDAAEAEMERRKQQVDALTDAGMKFHHALRQVAGEMLHT